MNEAQKDRGPLVVAAVAVGVMLLAGGIAAVGSLLSPSSPTQESAAGGDGTGMWADRPSLDAPVKLGSLTQVPDEAVVVDVHSPAKILEALRANAWAQETLKQPLGRGFVGSWAGFLGTRGEDLQADFKGTVADLIAGELLSQPFRVVWFTGRTAKQTPTVIVPKASGKQRAAFATINAVAEAGTFQAACARAKDGTAVELEISRWVIADQSVYAALDEEGRIALGRLPAAVQLGMCATMDPLETVEGTDLEISFVPSSLGREAEHLAMLLGIEGTPRAAFTVEGNRLVAKGLVAKGIAEGHLDVAAVSNDLLKLVPVGAPFVATLQVKLPSPLTQDSLAAHLSDGEGERKLETRQIALVWTPHGDKSEPTEVALVWSNAKDATLLKEAFTSPHLVRKQVCKHEVIASSKEVLASLERACAGKEPSLANAKPEVVAGFRAPASIGVGVDLGKLLSRLMMDAWDADGESGAAPPEMLEAKAQLEKLPFVRLAGKVEGENLVPGGKS